MEHIWKLSSVKLANKVYFLAQQIILSIPVLPALLKVNPILSRENFGNVHV
jgi:hypothetical protein